MTLREFFGRPWPALSKGEALGGIGAIIFLAVLLLTDQDGWIPILDDANLVFHEAGHPLYGIFGSTLALYGGTLGQLTFPFVTSASFWLRRQAAPCALCAAWFFENLLNIARYMADARAQLLPLVGCDGEHCHDWRRIFLRWGVLSHDTQVAGVVQSLGWLGLLSAAIWLFSRWRRNPTQDQ